MGKTSEMHIQMQDECISIVHRIAEGEILMLNVPVTLGRERKQSENSLTVVLEEARETPLPEITHQESSIILKPKNN